MRNRKKDKIWVIGDNIFRTEHGFKTAIGATAFPSYDVKVRIFTVTEEVTIAEYKEMLKSNHKTAIREERLSKLLDNGSDSVYKKQLDLISILERHRNENKNLKRYEHDWYSSVKSLYYKEDLDKFSRVLKSRKDHLLIEVCNSVSDYEISLRFSNFRLPNKLKDPEKIRMFNQAKLNLKKNN